MIERETAYFKNLSPEQISACSCKENMVLTACPGSGKTRTVSNRLAYLVDYYSNSRKIHIAITYTNRAADEIISRLEDMGVDANNIWAGTIHQFCMEYIIRPYAMYSDRLCRGYHIIDEYTQVEYKREIANRLGINCEDWNLNDNANILKAYKNILLERKEIDFDDILKTSLEILSRNAYVAENVASIIATIQVDEYQDTNELQYRILAKIYEQNKGIIISFIGDVNQAIYGSLGGIAKTKDEISTLFSDDFRDMHLTGCYRSSQKIIDYYINYAVDKLNITSMTDDSNMDGIIALITDIDKEELADYIARVIEDCLSNDHVDKDICVVAPQRGLIFPMANKLRLKLPNVKFDAPDITPFKYDPMNPFYLLARLTFTKPQHHERVRRKYANEVIGILRNDFSINIRDRYDYYNLLESINSVQKPLTEDGMEVYMETVQKFFSSIKVDIKNEHVLRECYNRFLEKSEERIKRNGIDRSCESLFRCFEEKQGVVISTIHGVKGEEYKTVIAFGLLNGYIPHWDTIINDKRHRAEISKKLLYVLGSRAKKNIYLIGERGRKTKGGQLYTLTDEIAETKWNYD